MLHPLSSTLGTIFTIYDLSARLYIFISPVIIYGGAIFEDTVVKKMRRLPSQGLYSREKKGETESKQTNNELLIG